MARRFLFLCALTLLLISPANAFMVLPMGLEEMVDQAGKVFVGRCLQIDSELDENGIPSTYARFRVLEGLKGVQTDETVLVKQIGAPLHRFPLGVGETAIVPPMANGSAAVASEVGEETLLFLYPESPLGFTSPVGLGQGKFLIRPSEDRSDLLGEIRRLLKK